MNKSCASCGIETRDVGKYSYCEKCETQRNDLNVRPLVWEYIGGKIGTLPNKRGTLEYSLRKMGFTYWGKKYNVSIYTRLPDSTPMGTIAFITNDPCVVIVNGEFEFDSLRDHTCKFFDNPLVENLPRCIESMNPEDADIVEKLQNETGLTE